MKSEFLAFALGVLSVLSTQEQKHKQPPLTVLSKDIGALTKAFNHDTGKTRLLLLVSPT